MKSTADRVRLGLGLGLSAASFQAIPACHKGAPRPRNAGSVVLYVLDRRLRELLTMKIKVKDLATYDSSRETLITRLCRDNKHV